MLFKVFIKKIDCLFLCIVTKAVIIVKGLQYKPIEGEPGWVEIIGLLIVICPLIFIPLWFVVHAIRTGVEVNINQGYRIYLNYSLCYGKNLNKVFFYCTLSSTCTIGKLDLYFEFIL